MVHARDRDVGNWVRICGSFGMTNIDLARAEAEKLLEIWNTSKGLSIGNFIYGPVTQALAAKMDEIDRLGSLLGECQVGHETGTKLIAALMVERDADVADKDEAYRQRNHLVAAMARLFPSGIRPTNIEGWSANWHGCVYIDLPVGQISYHYHDSQQMLFEDLPPYEKVYDGHDKDAVHERLEALWFAARNATEVRLHKNMELARHDGIVEARNAIRELRSELGAHPTDWQHANNLDHAIARIESLRALRRPDAPAKTEMPGEDVKSVCETCRGTRHIRVPDPYNPGMIDVDPRPDCGTPKCTKRPESAVVDDLGQTDAVSPAIPTIEDVLIKVVELPGMHSYPICSDPTCQFQKEGTVHGHLQAKERDLGN